mmetsp:Transcript_51507/g.118324  ORF Transcript_51507/g.118324 Transcript_51507/m.118324 type:complete len:512 (-) Transcript_51507:8-1543(-)
MGAAATAVHVSGGVAQSGRAHTAVGCAGAEVAEARRGRRALGVGRGRGAAYGLSQGAVRGQRRGQRIHQRWLRRAPTAGRRLEQRSRRRRASAHELALVRVLAADGAAFEELAHVEDARQGDTVVQLDAAERRHVKVEALELETEHWGQALEPDAFERVALEVTALARVLVVGAELFGLEQRVERRLQRAVADRVEAEGANGESKVVERRGDDRLFEARLALHVVAPLSPIQPVQLTVLLRAAFQLGFECIEQNAQELLHVVLLEGVGRGPAEGPSQSERVDRSDTLLLQRDEEALELQRDRVHRLRRGIICSEAPGKERVAELWRHVQGLQQRGEVARGALVDEPDETFGVGRGPRGAAIGPRRQPLVEPRDRLLPSGAPERDGAERLKRGRRAVGRAALRGIFDGLWLVTAHAGDLQLALVGHLRLTELLCIRLIVIQPMPTHRPVSAALAELKRSRHKPRLRGNRLVKGCEARICRQRGCHAGMAFTRNDEREHRHALILLYLRQHHS